MRSSTNQKVQIRLTLSGKKVEEKKRKRNPGLRSAYGSQCRQKRVVSYGLGFCVYIIVHYKEKPLVAYLSVYLDTHLEFCVYVLCLFTTRQRRRSCLFASVLSSVQGNCNY